jgi:Nucleotidyl transferase
MQIYPVILCGGSGTRLWPMSRGSYPKQYLKLTGDHTLVQQTALRLQGIADVAAPIIVTNNEQRFLVAEQLRQIDVTSSAIVLEPASRNTAPAIASVSRRPSRIRATATSAPARRWSTVRTRSLSIRSSRSRMPIPLNVLSMKAATTGIAACSC